MPRAKGIWIGLLLVFAVFLGGSPEGKGPPDDAGAAGDPEAFNAGRKSGLVAHYYKDPTEWDGNWKEGQKPTVIAAAWTFRDYRYTRIEPLVNHQFVRRGWFSVRWVGSIDLAPGASDAAAPKAKGGGKAGKGKGAGKAGAKAGLPSDLPPMPKSPAEASEPAKVPDKPVLVTFELWADDGARLLLDGKPLIDDWRPCPENDPSSHRQTVAWVSPGPHPIEIEYFQGESLRQQDHDPCKLFWTCEAAGIKRQIVPASHFGHQDSDLESKDPSTKRTGPPVGDKPGKAKADDGGADAAPKGGDGSGKGKGRGTE